MNNNYLYIEIIIINKNRKNRREAFNLNYTLFQIQEKQ